MQNEFLKGPESEDQYQNIAYLTHGGMSEIYTADDVINKKKVAIKQIRISNTDYKIYLKRSLKYQLNFHMKTY